MIRYYFWIFILFVIFSCQGSLEPVDFDEYDHFNSNDYVALLSKDCNMNSLGKFIVYSTSQQKVHLYPKQYPYCLVFPYGLSFNSDSGWIQLYYVDGSNTWIETPHYGALCTDPDINPIVLTPFIFYEDKIRGKVTKIGTYRIDCYYNFTGVFWSSTIDTISTIFNVYD